MFNNNNYLPDLNHYPPSGQLPPPNVLLSEPLRSTTLQSGYSYSRSGNFRFLSPTQVTSMPTWMSPTQVTSVPTWMPPTSNVGLVSAPGTGTSWQHSVPSSMPWANPVAPRFTAQSSLSQSVPLYSSQMTMPPQTTTFQCSPKPSVLLRRPKRQLQSNLIETELPDGPTSKKFLSERMAACFKQLQITEEHSGNAAFDISGAANPNCLFTQDNGWQRFRDVEKRLEENLEAEDAVMAAGRATLPGRQGSGILAIPEEVKEEANKVNSILPDAIVKSITNPCTDLVLYTPIEEVIAVAGLPPPPPSTDSSTAVCSSASVTPAAMATSWPLSHASDNAAVGVGAPAAMATSWPQAHASTTSKTTPSFNSGAPEMDILDFMDDDMDL